MAHRKDARGGPAQYQASADNRETARFTPKSRKAYQTRYQNQHQDQHRNQQATRLRRKGRRDMKSAR
jgi:hypothetical protein